MKALDYSKSIVQGRWWSLFGKLLVMGIIVGIAAIVVIFVVALVVQLIPLAIVQNLIIDCVGWAIKAYTLVVLTILFLNMEATKKA